MANLDDIEIKVTEVLDPHAKVLRVVAWVLVVTNVVGACVGLVKYGSPLWALQGVASAIVIFWMLVKSRKVEVPTP